LNVENLRRTSPETHILKSSTGKLNPETLRPPILEGPYDLAVIGGGINGTAIARDAALRGKSVILLEKGDFAEGTSSSSSKMVHGGLRYLEQLRFGLVYEALRERHLLLNLAPHLVRPQAFVLPIYKGFRRSPGIIRLGLFLYDLLAIGRRLGKSRFLSPGEVLERVPSLLADGLQGGGLYYDCVMNDARLTLANAMAASQESYSRPGVAVVRNYVAVKHVRPGSPSTLELFDRVTEKEGQVLAHRVVRALGPWTEPEHLIPSKGVHLVLPSFSLSDGLLLTHSGDGRVFFLVPWQGRAVVGTTETVFNGSPDSLRVEPAEVDYLLREVQRLFPGLKLGSHDILGTFAGVRPLAAAHGALRDPDSSSVSRVHRIVDEGSVLSVFGGKFTTYRSVAKHVLDHVFPGTACRTHRLPLPGGEEGPWEAFRRRNDPELVNYDPSEIERLYHRYGSRVRDVLGLVNDDPSLGEKLSEGHAELRAEVLYALKNEFLIYPQDFLQRRTTMRYTQDRGRSAYDTVEALIRAHVHVVPLGLDKARERYFSELDWEDQLVNSE